MRISDWSSDVCSSDLSGRGLKPTAMGELAMLKARHMLQELDHWASEMEAVRKGRSARLLIGAVPYGSGALLTQAIMQLYERHNIIIAIDRKSTRLNSSH